MPQTPTKRRRRPGAGRPRTLPGAGSQRVAFHCPLDLLSKIDEEIQRHRGAQGPVGTISRSDMVRWLIERGLESVTPAPAAGNGSTSTGETS